MLAILERKKEYSEVKAKGTTEGSTIGELKIYNDKQELVFSCYTLENIGASTSEKLKDKRILPEEYYLRWTSSSRNKALLGYSYWKLENHKAKIKDGTQGRYLAVWVMSDKIKEHNSRRILIHIGNYPQDTAGCILCGYRVNSKGYIENSTDCVNALFHIFEEYEINNFKLVIKEIKE